MWQAELHCKTAPAVELTCWMACRTALLPLPFWPLMKLTWALGSAPVEFYVVTEISPEGC